MPPLLAGGDVERFGTEGAEPAPADSPVLPESVGVLVAGVDAPALGVMVLGVVGEEEVVVVVVVVAALAAVACALGAPII